MNLHDDFTKRVIVHSASEPWRDSPMAGVQRRMLDRIGDEVARATTVVRYAPGSRFSAHTHTGGEEFVVLSGVFQDEHGDFPAGTYVRNPPTTHHTPGSEDGCVILVKLWQFDLADRTQIRIDMDASAQDIGDGVREALLHQDPRETVRYATLAPGAVYDLHAAGGAEVFVLSGDVTEGSDTLVAGSWLRVPEGTQIEATAGENGATLWSKSGHLPFAKAPVP